MKSVLTMSLIAFGACAHVAPATAGLLGGAAPVIIVREKPAELFAAVYVIYNGSLSEMVVAEEEVKKHFSKNEVKVYAASQDFTSIDQLKDKVIQKRILDRIKLSGGPTVMLVVNPKSSAGTEITYQITMTDADRTVETAVGEIVLDLNKQPTIGDSAALATRVAIRDVCSRFLKDRRISDLFRK